MGGAGSRVCRGSFRCLAGDSRLDGATPLPPSGLILAAEFYAEGVDAGDGGAEVVASSGFPPLFNLSTILRSIMVVEVDDMEYPGRLFQVYLYQTFQLIVQIVPMLIRVRSISLLFEMCDC